ncbi:MAG: hypothetical protein GEU88_03300 [Solirubrobacterales bacterium]|nr:hypothetical protein [Solirubrobacterales bacterium]
MTARERVERALASAEERSELGAFWALDRERALNRARRLDADDSHAYGLRPMAGVPVAIKDILDMRELPTTVGVAGRHPSARSDCAAVRRLKAAGAIPIGKTAMDPLGATTSGQAPGFAPCRNPVDARLSPGGSSSGSAVAVAAGIVPLALGTDTAGSIRIPAAYCGIVGFKPALSDVPRRGCVPVMPGFDTVGVLAASVGDCVLAYNALTGGDATRPPPRRALRVAVLDDLIEESEEPVARACELAGAELERAGVRVERARLDWRPRGFGRVLGYEMAQTWGEEVSRTPACFSEIIRETVEMGRRTAQVDYREAKGALERARVDLARGLQRFDAVLCPTVPAAAPDLEAESVRVSTRFTRIFNALDWPAVSLPASRDPDGRPIGVQIGGPAPRLGAILDMSTKLDRALRGAT